MTPKTMKIIYWTVTILFAAFMAMSIIPSEAGAKVMADLGYPAYMSTILGIAKLLGAIAIVQTKWTTIKEWAYAGFTIDIIGAAASFYFAKFPVSNIVFTLVFFIPLFASYYLGKKLSSLKA